MRVGTSYKEKETTSESLALKAKMAVDAETRKELIDPEHGLMRPGALPKVGTATAAGNKQILDSLSKVRDSQNQGFKHNGYIKDFAGFTDEPIMIYQEGPFA